MITINGPFLFTDSWWEIEANINPKTKKVKDVPKYRIKKTWDVPMISQYVQKLMTSENQQPFQSIIDVIVRVSKKDDKSRKIFLTVEQVLELPQSLKQMVCKTDQEFSAVELFSQYSSRSGMYSC